MCRGAGPVIRRLGRVVGNLGNKCAEVTERGSGSGLAISHKWPRTIRAPIDFAVETPASAINSRGERSVNQVFRAPSLKADAEFHHPGIRRHRIGARHLAGRIVRGARWCGDIRVSSTSRRLTFYRRTEFPAGSPTAGRA